MNLVSDTMDDGIPPSAWSRGVSKPEKPTQGAPARAECPVPARNPLPAARTVRKTHRSLNGGRVPYNGQAGAAIGCSVSATVFSHGTPSLCTHGLRPLLSTFPTPNSDSLFLVDLTAKNGTKANNRTMVDFPMKSSCCEGKFSWCGWAQVTRQAGP